MRAKLSRNILLLICFCALAVISLPYVQRYARAQVLAHGVTITKNSYFCDPEIVKPCPAKNRQTVYTAPTGESLTHFQELTVPGNPEFVQVRGHGLMANIYPEINSYWSLKSIRFTPAGLAAVPAATRATSTCNNGGTEIAKTTMLGYTVYEYETNNSRAKMLEWLAPDLQCQQLRRDMYWTDILEPTIDIADSVVIGDQPDSIWSLPADMKEVNPTDLYHALHVSRYLRHGYSADKAEQLWATSSAASDPSTELLRASWLKQHAQ